MGLLSRGLEAKGANSVWERWLQMMDGGGKSKAGPSVNLQSMWRNSVALACIRARANGVAQVPFKLYQEKLVDGLKRIEPARDHDLYDLMATKPNGWQTSFEFRQQLEVHLCLGNAYAFINRYRGKVAEVFILCNVRAEQQEDRSTKYWVRGKSGGEMEVPAANMWHLRGLSWDGFLGLDTLNMAREALGLAMALEESASALHSNGVRPSGVYSVEGNLSPTQHEQLVTWLKKEATAPGGTMVLDRNAKWLTTAMTSIDAQHKEMRDQQTEEVCRFFGVSPHKVFHSDKTATYASAEQFNIQHVVDCLMPEYAGIEQSADANLLTADERKKGYYFKFNANGLLRGSMKDRGEFYARALGSGGHPGWMSPDQVRELEEMNPMGGEAAKLPPASSAKPPADPKAEAAEKAIEHLKTKLAAVEDRPVAPPVINITLNQEPVTVKHEGGAVTVNTPEMKAPAAPVVNVQNDIHVPQGAAPTVQVDNHIQKQDAPHVTLEATITPELTVHAVLPARKTHSETKITRGADGITGSVTDGTERDA